MALQPAKSSLHGAPRSRALGAWADTLVSFAWIGALAMTVLTVSQRGWAPLNHDVAWILEGSARILNGAVFGRDIVDVNPPLAWWVGVLPAWLSRAADISLGLSFVLFTVAFVATSLAMVHRLLARAGRPSPFMALMLAGSAAVLLLAPGYDWGQREHIMTVAVLPYIVATAFRSTGTRISPRFGTAIGLMAAIGLCLKPHFLLIPFCLELLVIFRQRTLLASIRPETLAVALFAIAYAAAVWILTPDYIAIVMPEAAATYWAYGNSLPDTARRALDALWLPALLTFAVGLVSQRLGNLQLGLLVSAGAALVAALVQMKGWPYHLYPALALLTLASIAVVAHLSAGPKALAGAVVAALVLYASFPVAIRQGASPVADGGGPTVVSQLASTFRRYAGTEGSVFGFITSPRNVHPAVLAADVRWASTACCLHLLPAAIRAPDNAAGVAASERQLARVLADLRRERPAVIAIDAARYKLGFGGDQFDYQAFLRARPDFEQLLSDYVEQPRIGSYRVLVRADLAGTAG